MRSRCCLCVCVCVPPIVARQRLGRNVTAVTNTHATIDELLDASFSMWPVSYQGSFLRLIFNMLNKNANSVEMYSNRSKGRLS
jgi:hypothetical protein